MSEAVGIALIVTVFVAFAGLLVWRHHRVRSENDDLLDRGTPARATVERIAPVLGEDDVFVVKLNVDGHVLEVRWFLPSHVLPSVQRGSSVAIRLDAERRRAAFDARAMGFG
jgi:hypothetical protein